MKNRSNIFIITFLTVALVALLFVSRSLDRGYVALSNELADYLASQKQISLIVSQLGYTGFIHNFKNYVLRGEHQYYLQAVDNFQILEGYFNADLHSYGDPSMARLIREIQSTVKEYELKLELARQLHSQNRTAEEIDLQVRVNDESADRALSGLIAKYQLFSASHIQKTTRRLRIISSDLYLVVLIAVIFGVVICVFSWIVLVRAAVESKALSSVFSKQKLLDAAPNPTLVVSESGKVVVANSGAGSLFGCDKEMLLGKSVEDFMPGELRANHEDYRNLFFRTGGERTMLNPVSLATSDGTLKQVGIRIGLYELDGDRYAIVNMLDVSNLVDIKRYANQVEHTFRATFEMAPVGIAQIDLNGGFIKVNKKFATILGYDRKQLEALSLSDIAAKGDVEADAEMFGIERLMNDDVEHFCMEKRFVHKGGYDVWGVMTTTLYRDEYGKPDYLIAFIEDVSYRKRYEAELLASESKFKTIANYVNGVVLMATPGIEEVLFVSNRYEEIWGRSVASLKRNPRSFLDAVLVEDRPKVLAEIDNHRNGKWNVDYRIRGRDGVTRYIHDEGSPVCNSEGKLLHVVGLARDVTDDKIAQDRLQQTNKRLEQLAKFDPLTMAVRRPYAIDDLDECIALYNRYLTDATLIFIDLNEFKSVNDNYGHEAGDRVLAEFAKCVRANIRETDAFYRYAGDEFMILLRESSEAEAMQFISKLEHKLSQAPVPSGASSGIGIASGLVSLGSYQIDGANRWINLADEEMYRQKKHNKSS